MMLGDVTVKLKAATWQAIFLFIRHEKTSMYANGTFWRGIKEAELQVQEEVDAQALFKSQYKRR